MSLTSWIERTANALCVAREVLVAHCAIAGPTMKCTSEWRHHQRASTGSNNSAQGKGHD